MFCNVNFAMTAYIISVHTLIYKHKSVKNPLELEMQGICLELSPGYFKRGMVQVQRWVLMLSIMFSVSERENDRNEQKKGGGKH